MSEETTNKTNSPVMADTEPDVMLKNTSNGEMTKGQVTKTNSSNASEYDSADSYSDRENGSISGSMSDGSVIFEREEGDGQESTPAKKVDDDEDKKNPQYIPKRGTFYEHDDRTADDIDSPESEKNDKESKKKVWQDKKERWSHDRFNDMEQAPKSRSELIAIYGYDIRNEDGPPRARRRRRYGRGPNKYTRNWEDVDAYGKPTVIRKTTKKRRPKSQGSERDRTDQDDGGHQENENEPETVSSNDGLEQEKDQRIPNNSNEEKPNLPQAPPPPQQQQQQQYNQQQQSQQKDISKQNISTYQNDNRQYQQQQSSKNSRIGTGRISKPKREITDSDYRGFTKSRQFKSSPANRIRGRNSNSNQQNNKNIQDIEKDMAKMNIQDGGGGNFKSNAKHNNQRQGSMPPRLQAEQKGSKRYSSIRQRSLPETANPPFPQHGAYYGNDFNQQNQPPQPTTIITNNALHPTTAQLPQIPPQTLPPIPAQVPVTTTPILQAPPQFAPPFTPAPPFLPAGVPPTSFIPQQTGPILNYVQGQPQYPQPPYQGYQQPFNAVSQPTELYQPQGGITYYSTQEQQAAQRAAPPKRPKAAIPIVAPPEHRGRGRASNQLEPSTNVEADNNPLPETVENTAKFEDAVETAAAQ
ncbi:hypothetical protein Trydic_g11853 [Trypoxylus dichotomus]